MANLFLSENFLKGIEIGRRLATRIIEKVPIAYLYNEVQLPPLPEWDKVKYPYAVIIYTNLEEDYHLYMFDKNPIVYLTYSDYYDTWFTYLGRPEKCTLVYWGMSRNRWNERTEPIYELKNHVGFGLIDSDIVLWSNCDILNEDNSVYLSASEPIPVYE